jgi:hypothetical protein
MARQSDLAEIKPYLGPNQVNSSYTSAEDWLIKFESITEANWNTNALRVQAFGQKMGGVASLGSNIN